MKKDIIVIKIPLLDMNMAEAQYWFKSVSNTLPEDYTCICIPREVDWCEMNLSELEEMHRMLELCIEDVRHDIDTKTRAGFETRG